MQLTRPAPCLAARHSALLLLPANVPSQPCAKQHMLVVASGAEPCAPAPCHRQKHVRNVERCMQTCCAPGAHTHQQQKGPMDSRWCKCSIAFSLSVNMAQSAPWQQHLLRAEGMPARRHIARIAEACCKIAPHQHEALHAFITLRCLPHCEPW